MSVTFWSTAFKGSGDLTGEAIDKAFDDLGLDHNAWDQPLKQPHFGFMLAPRAVAWKAFPSLPPFFGPRLRGQDLEDERKVILEEIAMYEDEPFGYSSKDSWSGITQKMDWGTVFWEPIPPSVVFPAKPCRRTTWNGMDPTT